MTQVDSRYGLPLSPEATGNFFRGMSLGDFYGKSRPNPKKVPITSEQFLRWGSTPPNDEERRIRHAEELAFARSHGIEWVGGMESQKDTGSFLKEKTSYDSITFWIPHHAERQTILRLAESVAEEGKKPIILDAGCGSGAVTKILAADGKAHTFGADLLLHKMGVDCLPQVQGANLAEVDLWDTLGVFSSIPATQELLAEKRTLLQQIRDCVQNDPVFEHLSIFSASAQVGEPEALNKEVERLQQITQQRVEESPIDLVICSFMPSTADLTIPIRDGINPKAIVYIRPTSGMAGAGDYYCTEYEKDYPDEAFTFRTLEDGDVEPTQVNPNTIISYNPGANYRTVVHWVTPWQSNWMSWHGSFGYVFNAEVVVQLRNDVQLKPAPTPKVEKYSFDIQLEKSFSKPTEGIDFIQGIERANSEIFGK